MWTFTPICESYSTSFPDRGGLICYFSRSPLRWFFTLYTRFWSWAAGICSHSAKRALLRSDTSIGTWCWAHCPVYPKGVGWFWGLAFEMSKQEKVVSKLDANCRRWHHFLLQHKGFLFIGTKGSNRKITLLYQTFPVSGLERLFTCSSLRPSNSRFPAFKITVTQSEQPGLMVLWDCQNLS